MSNKIIGIKLQVDTDQGKKLSLVFQEAEKSAEALAKKEALLRQIAEAKVALIQRQVEAQNRLTSIVDRANTAFEKNSRGANLGAANAKLAYEKYQRTITSTSGELDKLIRKEQELNLTKRSFISGVPEEVLRAEERRLAVQRQQEDIAKRLAAAYNDQIAAIHRAEQAEAKRLATLKSAAYFGMSEQKYSTSPAARNPNISTNAATGARTFVPTSSYDPQAEAAKVKSQIEHENAIRDAGNNKALIQRTKYARDALAIEQKLAQDLSLIQQKVSSGFFNKDQGFAAQKRAVEDYGKAIKTLPSLNSHISEHKTLLRHVGEILLSYRALNATINVFQQALLGIPKAGIALESATASLTAIFKTSSGASRELSFLREEADRTGISINSLRSSYANASASFIAAGESAENTRKIFSNINTVVTTLHLSSDQTYSIYLALSQIFNKTKLQAEELTKQLAQTIPGVTNAQAKALNLTVAELYDSMKKGAISAHDAVIGLSKVLADTYGQEAFAKASQGLNANLGRLNTAWTLFSENVYKASSEMLISILKFTTGSIEGMVDLTSNTEELKETLKSIGIAIGSLAIGYATVRTAQDLFAKGTAIAGTNVSNLTKFISGLGAALKQLTFVGAIAELANFSGKLAEVAARRNELFQTMEDAQKVASATSPEQYIQYKAEVDPTAKTVKAQLEFLKKEKAKFTAGAGLLNEEGLKDLEKLNKSVNFFEQEYSKTITKIKNELTTTDKETKGTFAPTKVDASSEIAKAEVDYLKATGKEIEAARKDFLIGNQKDIDKLMQAYSQGDIQAGEALSKLQKAYLVQGKGGSGGSGGGNGGKSIVESYRATFEDIKSSALEMQQDIANALDRLAGLYEDNSLSIREYFGQKKQLQQTDIAVQKNVLEQELQLAFAQKDKVKIAQLSKEIRKVEAEDSKKSVENIRQEIIEYRKLNDLKVSISENILEAQGKNVEASVLSYYQANREAYAKAEAEGDTGLTGQLNALGQREASLANIAKIEEDRTRVNDVYNASLAKTNTLYNTGAITQLEAAYRTTNDNEKHIAQLEELIRKEEQAQQAVPALLTNPKDADRLRALRDELGNLKLEANAVGQYIQAQLTPALSDAFVGFATGAMTAKESFVSFAKGIMEQIAKIAAQKLAMEIIGGLISLAGSASGSGGGTVDGINMQNSSLSNIKLNANGGINSGMGIGNGVVLSSPTYFPNAKPTAFASGGVVAGEAGYEAALPLKRLKSGKLGVSMEGAGSSGGGIVIQNMNITLQAREDQTSEEQSKQIGEAIKANLKVLVQQELSSAKRSGGQLNPTQLAASF